MSNVPLSSANYMEGSRYLLEYRVIGFRGTDR